MSVTAKVTIQIDIHVGDSWGDDCTMRQIRNQAIEAAHGIMGQVMNSNSRIKNSVLVSVTALEHEMKAGKR